MGSGEVYHVKPDNHTLRLLYYDFELLVYSIKTYSVKGQITDHT
jgi:hypothetical protein